MSGKTRNFRIKINFSELTDSFWQEAWFYVQESETIKDVWCRCSREFLEDVRDTGGFRPNYGLFLENRYLFPSLPANVLKEDDTVWVRLLNGCRPSKDKKLLHLNAEAIFQNGLIAQVPASMSDANSDLKTSRTGNEILEKPQVLEMSFEDSTTALAPDTCAPPLKKRKKRNGCEISEDNNVDIVGNVENVDIDREKQNVTEVTKKKKKKSTEETELQSVETMRDTVNAESVPEDTSISETPKKHKKKKDTKEITDQITTEDCLIDFVAGDNTSNTAEIAEPQETNTEEPSFCEFEQNTASGKRKRTRRRKPKAVEVVPEPVPQVGSFRGDLFYKPPLSKRLYTLENKSNTIIRFEEDGDRNDDVESSDQVPDQERESVHLRGPGPSSECQLNFSVPSTVRSSPKVKAQAPDPGLVNLLALTQSPSVLVRKAVATSTPSTSELEPVEKNLPVEQEELQFHPAPQRLRSTTFSKNPPIIPEPSLDRLLALTRSPVVFSRNVITASTSSAGILEPVKEELPIEQNLSQRPVVSQSLRTAPFSKNAARASDWDIQNYEQYPLISEPRVKEVIAFKELELSASYEPVMSNYKVAQIVKICPLTKNVVLEILAGETKIVRSGRFEIEEEDVECVDLVDEESNNQRECCWKDLKETRLIYP